MEKIYHKRLIDNTLIEWKNEEEHKPLLIRGARQVGKSSSVKQLATHFQYFIEVNFENNAKAKVIFDKDLIPHTICEELSILFNTPVIAGETLLFFDEIQACPRAIQSLRYFYENYPALHVIAAGSLLELALEQLPSLGVGRLSFLYMYPFTFGEFCMACGETLLWNAILKGSPNQPLFDSAHQKAVELLKRFLVLGGMPAVVAKYVQTGDFHASMRVLDELVETMRGDFVKYRERIPALRISTVFESLADQSGKKVVISRLSSDYNARQLKESIDLLVKAGLVIPVYHSSANGIPLGATVDSRRQKIIFFDTGVLQRVLKLDISDIMLGDNIELINKGAVAENYVGLELLKHSSPLLAANLYYWQREVSGSEAEVDYVIQSGRSILPVEVKSGHSGKMKSMFMFLSEKKHETGVRTSLENFARYGNINVIPLYAIGLIAIDS